jgi:putative endonuclease
MGYRKVLGTWGESLAVLHLEAHGYQVVVRNWRCPRGEIDIIVQNREEIIFVEVKTRRGKNMGSPEEALTKAKSDHLIELSKFYLAKNDLDVDWQIDLVAVEVDDQIRLLRLEHLPNAVLGW